MTTEQSPQISQAVADILPRIRALADLSEDKLEGEMDSLKQALLENPAASALILDEDVGMLVAALRRVTGQSLAEATKEKKVGKASKKPLSAEEMAQAFEEL